MAKAKTATKKKTTKPKSKKPFYDADGNKLDYVCLDLDSGEMVPDVVLRGEKAIREAYQEFWDMVWWNRHQVSKQQIEDGRMKGPLPKSAYTAAKRIEKKYGLKGHRWDDFEWGLLSGRMSALAWVLGMEWDDSLCT